MPRGKDKSADIVPFPKPELPSASEEALALYFAENRQTDLRYVASWNTWMIWDAFVWRPDRTLAVFDSIRPLIRAEADRILDAGARDAESEAKAVASARTVAAVERLARADRRLAATSEIWDMDLMAISTPGGIVDLTNGELRPPSPTAFSTKLTLSGPDVGGYGCPQWLAFLELVTAGDQDLVAYLQRVAGYCLTGRTGEHVLFFLYGPGRNGKSVFVDTLSRILGHYSAVASMDTLIEARGERHPTELAMLRGARLVTAIESEKNRQWAEARVKQLTGGDPISARFMRQDLFTYTPQFKLLIAGNHLPRLQSMDDAMRSRFHVVPFAVIIPKDLRIKDFKDLLLTEAQGILTWAIEGCLAWQRDGLAPPEAVRVATQAYVGEQDGLARWIADCCDRDVQARTAFADLFASWKSWAGRSGEFVGSAKSFAKNLELRGFEPDRNPGGAAARVGLRLRSQTSL